MERLTKRLPSGAADYNYPASCYFDDDSGPDRIAQSAFRQRCVEQLADYEDTWLTPKQCKNAKVIIESAFSNDTSKAERIRELLKADREGRLVVLPCKDWLDVIFGDQVLFWGIDKDYMENPIREISVDDAERIGWNDGKKDRIYCLGWVDPMTDAPLPECVACSDFVDKAQDDLEAFYGRADNG